MGLAEVPVAKGAFGAGMGAAAFHAAEAGPVSLVHPLAVGEVVAKVADLLHAAGAGADGFVPFDKAGVERAEGTPTVLAGVE